MSIASFGNMRSWHATDWESQSTLAALARHHVSGAPSYSPTTSAECSILKIWSGGWSIARQRKSSAREEVEGVSTRTSFFNDFSLWEHLWAIAPGLLQIRDRSLCHPGACAEGNAMLCSRSCKHGSSIIKAKPAFPGTPNEAKKT